MHNEHYRLDTAHLHSLPLHHFPCCPEPELFPGVSLHCAVFHGTALHCLIICSGAWSVTTVITMDKHFPHPRWSVRKLNSLSGDPTLSYDNDTFWTTV